MMRGFTREVLAIASWAAAAAAAYYFYPMVMPYLTPYIHKEVIAQAASAAIVFFVTLIVVSHSIPSTMRMADHVVVLLPDGPVEGSPDELQRSTDPRIIAFLSDGEDASVVAPDDLPGTTAGTSA